MHGFSQLFFAHPRVPAAEPPTCPRASPAPISPDLPDEPTPCPAHTGSTSPASVSPRSEVYPSTYTAIL